MGKLQNKTNYIKFIRKWMLLAKAVADQNDACYSRQIGTVIVDPKNNSVVSVGYNAPPQDTPHCDSYDFLKNFFWPQLKEKEKKLLIDKIKQEGGDLPLLAPSIGDFHGECMAKYFAKCGQCPRRLINAASGERSELCSCKHSEVNALNKLPISSVGLVIYCWCGVPCIQCAGAIINSGIDRVYCLLAEDYHPVSRFLFNKSQCELIEYKEEQILGDEL